MTPPPLPSPIPAAWLDDPESDAEAAELYAWLNAELDAGREEIPPETPPPRAVIALGEAADLDLAMLGRMTGPDGLAGLGFTQDAMADALRPGPILHALTAEAASDPPALNDNQELGTISASRRLQNHAAWLELTAIADYTQRNETRYTASVARGDQRQRREGEYAREALAMELTLSPRAAADRMELALDLATRLEATFTGLHDGTISEYKAQIIHRRTSHLSAQDATAADAILATAAPATRPESLDRKAYRLARKLDPDDARHVKDDATAHRRVEGRQEASGNASLSGRELNPADVLALMSDIKAEAHQLRDAGMPGTLDEIMTTIYLNRLARRPTPAPGTTGEDPGPRPGAPDGGPGPAPGPRPGAPSGGHGHIPVPAIVNILVSAATLTGISETMGEANSWLLDPADSWALVEAASQHPATRWCVTVIDDTTGEAVAHGCSRGHHPWTAPNADRTRDGTETDATTETGTRARGDPNGHIAALLRDLKVTFEPIAKGTCNHKHREDQYEPSRKLRHLINARTNTCPAPGCGARAIHNEADHTQPWPDGDTCEHNISPPCTRHHHAKHAPGWNLDQSEPGHMTWTTPGGRTYHTGPTKYEI